jgi:hypothetical protein
MRKPFSESELSAQLSVSLAAVAEDAVASGRTIEPKRNKKHKNLRLWNTAHLVEEDAEYRYEHRSSRGVLSSGNPATVSRKRLRPVALRPALSRGLPFAEVRNLFLHHPSSFGVPSSIICRSTDIYRATLMPPGCRLLNWHLRYFFRPAPMAMRRTTNIFVADAWNRRSSLTAAHSQGCESSVAVNNQKRAEPGE